MILYITTQVHCDYYYDTETLLQTSTTATHTEYTKKQDQVDPAVCSSRMFV